MIEIKELKTNDISSDMLLNFKHHQVITKKWINQNNDWVISDTSDLRKWSKDKRLWIPQYLRQQIKRGGSVVAAFDNNVLVGFCCVDGCIKGSTARYANMTMLFVDDEWKRRGVGRKLFEKICKCSSRMQAEKLFISAIPCVETIAFYLEMGCCDATEIIPEYVDTEQDRYLEYSLID